MHGHRDAFLGLALTLICERQEIRTQRSGHRSWSFGASLIIMGLYLELHVQFDNATHSVRRPTPSACPATIPGERERERKPLSQGRYEVFSWMWKAPVEENLEAPVRSSFSRWFCLAFRTLRHEGFVIANENILRRHDLDLHRNHFSDAS